MRPSAAELANRLAHLEPAPVDHHGAVLFRGLEALGHSRL